MAEKFSAFTALTDAFCERHLDDEYWALIHRVIEVRAMDLTQKVQLADELYRAQPHVLASFLVQNKLGVRPGEMEFLLEPCRSSSMTAADY